MRRIVHILFLLFLGTACFAQANRLSALASNEPICGFTTAPFYLDAAKVRQGLAIDLMSGDVRENEPASLRFFVHQKPRNQPVDELQVEHEKMMHVFGVRDDLSGFFHVHPMRIADGLWAIDYAFPKAGRYRIWSDVKYRGVSYAFAHPMITVPPAGREGVKDPPASPMPGDSRYRIQFQHPDVLRTGITNRLEFSIHDQLGNLVPTENYLGAAMHLVIVKDDLSIFLHGHPDNHGSSATNVYFSQTFPLKGRYKLFLQYRPSSINLLPDAALQEEFYVDVRNGN